MENLIGRIEDLRDNDIYYYVKANIDRLCARGKTYKLLKIPNVVSVIIADTTVTEYGKGDEAIKSTREKVRRIKKGQEIKVFPFDTFEKNGEKHLVCQIGGDRGIVRTGFYRVVMANNKAKYWAPPIDLIRVLPEGDMDMGLTPAEHPVERPIFVLEPRAKGKTAEVVGYEAIADRTTEFWVKVNVSCPLTQEDVLTLLHGIEDVPLGPTKRGHLTILEFGKGDRKDFEGWMEKHEDIICDPNAIIESTPLFAEDREEAA
jgi:hypothetical protein